MPRALASLPRGVAVLVLDALSGDDTADVARSAGATVIQRKWIGFVNARLFALAQVKTRWTLMLDADEALDEKLRASISNAEESAVGFALERTTYFCEKPIRMWSGELLVRLFRTELAILKAQPALGGEAELHERWSVAGKIGHLEGTLAHYSYPDVRAYARKFNEYTSIEARSSPRSWTQFARQLLVVGPRFWWLLIARGELLDGWRGWYVAYLSAIYPLVTATKALRRT
ncbi:MAG: glycosyltransferase family 2 protein [Candidatus Eremiobacteraeota bacterium]|nr:glycosyltransferase family 2 protein [Candidatus Eremiobacteraeota bacterium]